MCLITTLASCNSNQASPGEDSLLDTYSVDTHSDCFDDFSDYDACSQISTFTVSPYYHEDYPDCYFTVEIDYVQCATPGFFQIIAGDYRLISHYEQGSSVEGCSQYMNDLALATAGGDDALLEFVIKFDKVVMRDLGNMLATLDVTAPLPCGSNNKISYTWTRAACFAICVTAYQDGPFEMTSHRRIPCPGSGCCLTTSEICYNLLTNEFEISNLSIDSPGNGDCEGPILIDAPILGEHQGPGDGNTSTSNCDYITPCQFECE